MISTGKVRILLDRNGSSFNLVNKANYFFYLAFVVVELYFWSIVNRINPLLLRIRFNSNKIKEDDVIFNFLHSNYEDIEFLPKYVEKKQITKILHLSHYSGDPSSYNQNIKNIKNLYFFGENNLKKNNAFFEYIFTNYRRDVFNLPFSHYGRFNKKVNFLSRKNKCIATGSLEKRFPKGSYIDVKNFFQCETLHPLRLDIFEKENKISNYIDNQISLIEVNEKVAIIKKKFNQNTVFDQFINKIRLTSLSYKHDYTKRSYYKLNFNTLFNDYRMFVCPEEITGFPAISFVEGMAAGSVYLGNNNDLYNDLGMKDGVNYVSHDESLECLIEKIKFYQTRERLLEKIAIRGMELSMKNFSEKRVTEIFFDLVRKCSELSQAKG